MSQLGFPTPVTAVEVMRCTSFGDALEQCRKVAALEPKQVYEHVHTETGKPVDKAAWSSWASGAAAPKWPQLVEIMDACGNDAPLLWMLHARGYELSSLRQRETELERELRLAREELAKERQERAVERRLFTELRIAA